MGPAERASKLQAPNPSNTKPYLNPKQAEGWPEKRRGFGWELMGVETDMGRGGGGVDCWRVRWPSETEAIGCGGARGGSPGWSATFVTRRRRTCKPP